MGIEIERKFLVKKDSWNATTRAAGTLYRQGYISTDPAKTIRVRQAGDKGFLTIKGMTTGASRAEFEYAIPLQDAIQLLDDFCPATLSKIRYTIDVSGKCWEIDEFLGDNEGLLIAEIELTSEDEKFETPEWTGMEVTGDNRYYNSYISRHPYKTWQ